MIRPPDNDSPGCVPAPYNHRPRHNKSVDNKYYS